ncbi:unnamed protein product [Nezara viridula]|uniref:Major facilitator superfamily (MFS) profile domain-containing protein n=1 Tax=Nezara viridula TaxID=85310 RepID=A0A9P0HF70_NEZVI|nr:unnamed protein product [Nezara viridula]
MDGRKAVEEDKPSHLRAYLIVLAVNVLQISTGAVMGWTSPSLPKLNLTTHEQSLVGSLYSLGAAPGPFIVTFGLNTIGRKGVIYVLWACFMSSWIIMASSQNLYVIYIARLMGGIGVGGTCSGVPVYIAEVALRAILLEKENSVSFLVGIRKPVALKALGLGIFVVAMQQFQGVNPINAYNQIIFEQADLNFPAKHVPVIYLFVGMVFLLLPVLLVNKLFGVKTAYIASGFGASISLALLGLYFYLINSGGVDMHDYSYISVVFLVLFSLFSHLGVSPLSWPIVAEILPLSVKGVCTGICGCISSLIGFLYLAVFPSIAKNYGYSTDFFG